MANWCSLAIEINCASEEDAKSINAKIEAELNLSKQNNREAIYIGCESRYLFSANSSMYDKDFYLYGEVKWGFDTDEVREFICWIQSIAQIQNLSVEYEEGGCALFGRYEFDHAGNFTHRYLPQAHYPEFTEENSESYYDLLLSVLNEYGVVEKLTLETDSLKGVANG